MLKSRMRTEKLVGAIFAPEREAETPWLAKAWTAALFSAGIIGWSYVLGWGLVPLNFHDWTDINIPRLTFLQNALRAGALPLHMGDSAALHGVTDRFFTLPDVITTPQTLLLLVLPVPAFVVADVLIHYVIGFAGLLMLRRHFGWSLYVWTMVFLLFVFNGHILAHYTVGHLTWGPYFVFPLILLMLFRFLDGDTSWRAIGIFSALMSYMVLAGGQHHLTWVVLFMAMLAPVCGRRAWWLLAAVIGSLLLSAVRLLPPALELESFRAAGLIADVIGYPSLMHLLSTLVILRREQPAFNQALPANIWFFDSAYYEFNAYVGAIGAVVIVVFGLYHWLRSSWPRYWQLAVPALAMVALSLGTVYRIVRAAGVPLFESERYTARMFSLPLTLLIVMAGTILDQYLRERAVSMWQRVLALFILAYAAIDISANIRLSRVAVSSGLFGPSSVNEAATVVQHRDDPTYVMVLAAGLVVSLATAATLWILAKRDAYSDRADHRLHQS
jgi:hypothetical protein